MKKYLTGIATGIVLTLTISATYAYFSQFKDVNQDSDEWYTEAIYSLYDKNLIQGYSDGEFKPNKPVTRAELAVIINRLIQYIETGSVAMPKTPTKEDFQLISEENGTYAGKLSLTGYVDVKFIKCPEGGMCSKDVDYAYFVFEENDNQAIYDYLEESKGNSFLDDNSIGLGCYEKDNNHIYADTYSDNMGSSNTKIEGDELKKLLAATKAKPVTIEAIKYISTAGFGAPDCFSQFNAFTVK